MTEIALYEAKNKLSALIDAVARGEQITIPRRGQAAAMLVPIDDTFNRAKARQAAEALLGIRKGVTLGDLTVKDLVNEGRP